MELADVAVLAFIGVGLVFQSVRYYRSDRRIKAKQKYLVSLLFCETEFTRKCPSGIVLVFDRIGHLVRKFPEADIKKRKDRSKICCSVEEGVLSFCVLFTSRSLSLSGVYDRKDIERLFGGNPDILIAETALQEVKSDAPVRLNVVREVVDEDKPAEASSVPFSMLLPPEIVTDAMSKDLQINMSGCGSVWEVGDIHYPENEPDHWLSLKHEGEGLVIHVRANFSSYERIAAVELCNGVQIHTLKVRQQMAGMHAVLTVNRNLYVTDGQKDEVVPFKVAADNEQATWHVKAANANDGGCWYAIKPAIGIRQTGTKVLEVHISAKPVNVRSRSLSVTLETGTYPFCQTTDIVLIQGVCFNYYIEYPQDDICARHSGAIETPLDYREADGVKSYIICVDSNQPWHIVYDKKAEWMEVGEPELLQGHYDGRFVVRVHSNEGNAVRGGLPAARSTVLSLINDTGVVKDILVYQGGYVRIRGKYWLDRNLLSEGKLAQVAVPVGLEEGCTLNHGGYFQFGSRSELWTGNFTPCKGSWHAGKPETPLRASSLDPSPVGWRVPSYIELETFMSAPVASLGLHYEDNQDNICFLSDDGVPVYLPLCGHRSHISGCRIVIPHGHRYWTGSSQRTVYGYSLCVESNRRMYIMHDMKKCGFPVRSILE
ncbi:hypothetical protein [Bacteroides fluxus]